MSSTLHLGNRLESNPRDYHPVRSLTGIRQRVERDAGEHPRFLHMFKNQTRLRRQTKFTDRETASNSFQPSPTQSTQTEAKMTEPNVFQSDSTDASEEPLIERVEPVFEWIRADFN